MQSGLRIFFAASVALLFIQLDVCWKDRLDAALPPVEKRTVDQELSFLQMAELTVDGCQLVCDRDAEIILP